MWIQALAASVLLLPFYLLADKHALRPVSSGLILYAALCASIAAPLSWMALAGVLIVELIPKLQRKYGTVQNNP
jgi:hypothetical protein